jgi:hypothetical protein
MLLLLMHTELSTVLLQSSAAVVLLQKLSQRCLLSGVDVQDLVARQDGQAARGFQNRLQKTRRSKKLDRVATACAQTRVNGSERRP